VDGLMMRVLVLAAFIFISNSVLALSVGDMAPNFRLKNLETGKLESLKKYRGKVVYLDFWASWCGPCRQSLPLLNELRSELKRKGFEVLAVNLDEDTKDAQTFLEQFPVVYPVLLDPQGKVPQKYDLPGMPTSFLIDKKGRVQKIHVGFKPKDMKGIRSEVISYLRKK
jgi:thiol-disulfide isomerase/thioredoxin